MTYYAQFSASSTISRAGRSIFLLALLLICYHALHGQNIYTFAGNGTYSFSGDGGQATTATMRYPYAVAYDGSGNIYVADANNNRIRKITSTGVITTVVGSSGSGFSGDGGPATAATLNGPVGLCFDASGNMYIADQVNHRIRKVNTSGTISTYAGTGSVGFSGDGGPATAAAMYLPTAVIADATGNIYIADQYNHRIRMVNTSGTMSTFAGMGAGFGGDGGPATAATMNLPCGMALDAAGNMYITDFSNHRIRKVNTSGVMTTVAGTSTSGFGGDGGPATAAIMNSPWGICTDAYDNIYIGDFYGQRVRVINTSGIINAVTGTGSASFSGDGGPATAATVNDPSGLCVTPGGTLYLCDAHNNRVRSISIFNSCYVAPIGGPTIVCPGNTITLTDGSAGGTWSSSNPSIGSIGTSGIVTGISTGNVLMSYTTSISCTASAMQVVTVGNPIIRTIAGNGSSTFSGDGGAATSGAINYPTRTAMDASGNLYLGDYANSRIRKISSSGIITTIAGNGTTSSTGDGGPASAATLSGTAGIAVDGSGNIYFADYNSYKVRKINTSGVISTVAGTGTSGYSGDGGAATAAQITNPWGVAADQSGNVYFSDRYNHRIRKINTSGIITTIAGTGTSGFSGDGGPATAANINQPVDLAMDIAGNLYFSDFNNHRIRKIDTGGIIRTIAGNGTAGYSGDGGAGTSASLNYPIGVGPDSAGNVYVGDYGNNRIRKINTAGVISTIAGTGTSGFGGDGSSPLSAQIRSPYGVAVYGTGDIYMCDAINYRIRRISPEAPVPPSTISGSSTICIGVPLTLTNTTAGGVWSSSTLSVVTVGSSTGVVNGVSTGTATITYSVTYACGTLYATKSVTVVPFSTGIITGPSLVCPGNTITLSDTVTGGTWSSSNTSIATVSGGVVTGVSAGNVTISYSVTGSCGTATARQQVMVGLPVITTFAGTPATLGYSGDGGPATAARMYYPHGFCIDPSGNFYIADDFNGAIRKVNTSGTISTFAGTGTPGFGGDGGPATAARFNQPFEIILDGVGNMYVSDASNHRVRKISTSGIVTTIAGTGTPGYSGDGGPATAATINTPCGLALDASGNLYFGDCLNQRVRKVTPAGVISTYVGTGSASFSGDGGPATAATLHNPNYIYTDPNGDLIVVDNGNHRIRKVDQFGIIKTIVGNGSTGGAGDGGPATAAALWYPGGVAFDGAGNMYLAADVTHNVRMVNAATNIISSVAGTGVAGYSGDGGPPTAAKLNTVVDVIFDASGNLYIADQMNQVVRKVAPVAPVVLPIIGPSSICEGGLTGTCTDATPGGTWSSSNPAIATIGSTTGVVAGLTAGTVTITYTAAFVCGSSYATRTLTVMATDAGTITGPGVVCLGSTAALSDVSVGGTWSSSSPAIGSIGSSSGIVGGLTLGTTTISYVKPSGCYTTKPVTVTPNPSPITGTRAACIGNYSVLTDATPGGTWSSTTPAIGSVGSAAGIVAGIAAGTTTISYTLATGCASTAVFTVYPTPLPIMGGLVLCVGSGDTLTDAAPGGTWTSSDYTIAGIDPLTGAMTGASTGYATITYSSASGCITTATASINPAPTAITGVAGVCTGGSNTLFNGVPGGTWSSSASWIATIVPGTGVYTGVIPGTATMTYTTGPGCSATFLITVYPIPPAITGPTHVCAGGSISLSDAVPGGAWSSTSGTVGSIGTGTGALTGITAGTTIVSYSFGFGVTCAASITITVDAIPVIGGTLRACPGTTTALTTTVPGGSWTSSVPAVAAIGSTGIVTGYASGTTTITYTSAAGCSTMAVVTINPAPAPIMGAGTVCVGSTITLSDATAGGSWSRSNTNVSVGSGTGIVTGITAGSGIITYTLPTGCLATKTVTVNSSPGAITGTLNVCIGAATTLSNATPGGSWSSATPTVATVGTTTGLVSGIAAGTAVITYALGAGCLATATVTVMPLPAVITGPASVCAGGVITLADATTGGSWSSSNPGVMVGSGTGAVTGVTAGVALITYTTGGGCYRSSSVTVNPLPGTIIGPSALCAGATALLTDVSPGGTWSSGTMGTATIGSSTGLLTGVTTGVAGITYTLPTGCITTTTETVSTAPAPITGPLTVCTGSTATLTDAVPGGTWDGSSTVAVGTLSGAVTGITAGAATITYSLGSGCTVTRTMTVIAGPASITGAAGLCAGATATLADATTGGSWSSGATGIATIGSATGLLSAITAGSVTITYTVGATGCTATKLVTVYPTPTPITGAGMVCTGSTAVEADGIAGGTWSTSGALLTIDGTTGVVTGITAGSTTITYTIGSCSTTRAVTVGAASPITGTAGLCIGTSSTLADASPGGTWSSGSGGVATVGSASGVVAGITAGTSTITYTLSSGCAATRVVTVNPGPSPIGGTLRVCRAGTTTLTDAAGGGTWTIGATGIATIGSATGSATGIATGTAIVTYSLGSGCSITAVLTVNPLPAVITGAGALCAGATTTLTDSTAGGTWTSSSTSIAIIGSATGLLTGVITGSATITYTLPTGCFVTRTETVTEGPLPIAGPAAILCVGTSVTLTDATSGGVWTSSNPVVASVGSSSGLASGISAGSVVITYSLGAGCFATRSITVNPAPPPITGINHVCVGGATTLSIATTGGLWSSGSTGIANVGSLTGVVTGVGGGLTSISYVLSAGCVMTYAVTVNAVPPITGTRTMCAWGDTLTVHDSDPSGIYTSTLATVMALGGGAGRVTSFAPGTSTVTYTLPSGCSTTVPFTVNPLPALVTGALSVCVGSTGTLHNATPGGVWSSGATSIATVGSLTGVVNGLMLGTAPIRYTLPTGCKVDTTVHVVAGPTFIIGYPAMVAGTTTTYTDATPGGTWSCAPATLATIGLTTGVAHAISPGLAMITYTVTSTGCATTKNVTINPAVGISPPGQK